MPQISVIIHNISKKSTDPKPFSFAQRDEQMMAKKQEKIEKVFEEEKAKREFKANPIPDHNKPVGLPIKEVQMPTEPKPFSHEVFLFVF